MKMRTILSADHSPRSIVDPFRAFCEPQSPLMMWRNVVVAKGLHCSNGWVPCLKGKESMLTNYNRLSALGRHYR
jgi:hypothetical protein